MLSNEFSVVESPQTTTEYSNSSNSNSSNSNSSSSNGLNFISASIPASPLFSPSTPATSNLPLPIAFIPLSLINAEFDSTLIVGFENGYNSVKSETDLTVAEKEIGVLDGNNMVGISQNLENHCLGDYSVGGFIGEAGIESVGEFIYQNNLIAESLSEQFCLAPVELRSSNARKLVESQDGLCFNCDQWILGAKSWNTPTETPREIDADCNVWLRHTQDCHQNVLKVLWTMQEDGRKIPQILRFSKGSMRLPINRSDPGFYQDNHKLYNSNNSLPSPAPSMEELPLVLQPFYPGLSQSQLQAQAQVQPQPQLQIERESMDTCASGMTSSFPRLPTTLKGTKKKSKGEQTTRSSKQKFEKEFDEIRNRDLDVATSRNHDLEVPRSNDLEKGNSFFESSVGPKAFSDFAKG